MKTSQEFLLSGHFSNQPSTVSSMRLVSHPPTRGSESFLRLPTRATICTFGIVLHTILNSMQAASKTMLYSRNENEKNIYKTYNSFNKNQFISNIFDLSNKDHRSIKVPDCFFMNILTDLALSRSSGPKSWGITFVAISRLPNWNGKPKFPWKMNCWVPPK